MQHPEPVARRLFELTEPISLVNFFSPEPTEALLALGLRNYWDGYFAGRSAPLGQVPPQVVHAIFYNFAEGEAARHLPPCLGVDHARGGARGTRAGQRRGVAAGASATSAGLPGLVRAGEHSCGRRAVPARGTRPVRRPPCAPGARGACGPALARGHPASRAPREAPRRGPRLGGRGRHRGARAPRPRRGHLPGRDVRQDPSPSRSPVGRGHGGPARPPASLTPSAD